MVSPCDASFQLAPKAFKGVSMSNSANIYPASMTNGSMLEPKLSERMVDDVFVRVNGGLGFNVFLNDGHDRCLFDVRDNRRFNLFASFHHAKDNRFPRSTTPDFKTLSLASVLGLASNVSFVHLNMIFKWCFRTLAEKQTDLFSHSPSRFISHTNLPLDFHSRNPVFGIGKKEDSKEPEFKWSIRLMKDGVGEWMKLIAAELAGITLPACHPMEFSFPLAVRTYFEGAITLLKNVIQTSVVMGVFGIKVSDRKFVGHGISPLGLLSDPLSISDNLLAVKG